MDPDVRGRARAHWKYYFHLGESFAFIALPMPKSLLEQLPKIVAEGRQRAGLR
jgi:hypothetical protein